ncbi:hypothetical protein ACFV0A_20690, partial [Streptomyces sp. NPDC059552]
MRTVRYAVGGLGLVVTAFGGFLLVREPGPWRIALWLAGGLLVHDALVAPLVIAVAALAAAPGVGGGGGGRPPPPPPGGGGGPRGGGWGGAPAPPGGRAR